MKRAGGFFGRLKGLFLRLDLSVGGRRAEGRPRSPQATTPFGAARSVLDKPEHGGRLGGGEGREAYAEAGPKCGAVRDGWRLAYP